MMKMNSKKKSKLATKILICASLCASLFPVQANADMAEDIRTALLAAGGNAQEVAEQMATLVWSQAKKAVGDVYDGSQEWGADVFLGIAAVAVEYDVALNALIPSVSGCISLRGRNTPLEGVSVVGVGAVPGISGSLVPILATTSGRGLKAKIFGLDVQEAWMTPRQKEKWRRFDSLGCYWMPMPPGLIDGAISVIQQDSAIQHTVIPMAIGYAMSPPAKLVQKLADEISVTDLDNPFESN